MSVVIETTLGDITVDLYLEQRPVTCLNFLKLCKMKYYNFNLFHSIRSGFIAQTGDPTAEGFGGQSIFGLLEGPEKRFFSGEKLPKIRHTNTGTLSMVCTGDMMVGSQFFFTLAPDLDSLDGIHCVIGEVTEGHDILRMLNDVICDETHRPYRDVRITHTVVLEDPFNDPTGLRAPSRSPSPSAERLKGGRIAPDEDIDEAHGKSAQEIQELIEEKEAKARATILEIVGDLPDADIAPPENVLFVCKLNPVTTDEDLEIIFSRFGKIVGCEVIRDKKTGDSLQYAFIEFSDKKSCEDAYFKMDNVLIDDRRIHVDFSQSVSRMRWMGKGKGIRYFNNESKDQNQNNHASKQHYKERGDHKNGSFDDFTRRKHENYNREHHRNKNDRENRDKERDRSRTQRSRSRSRVEKPGNKSRYDRERSTSKPRNIKTDSEKIKSRKERSSSKSRRAKDTSSNRDRSRSRSKLDRSLNESSQIKENKNKSSNRDRSRSRSKLDRSLNESSQIKENKNKSASQITELEPSRKERERSNSRSKTNKSHDESLKHRDKRHQFDNKYQRSHGRSNRNDSEKDNRHKRDHSDSDKITSVYERTKKSESSKDKSMKHCETDHSKIGESKISNNDKSKHKDDKEKSVRHRKENSNKNLEEKDSQSSKNITESKSKNSKMLDKGKKKNTKILKKKRKHSTSTSDSSSDSSSSESSSSSGGDKKKKSLKRRKKKVSTSSSSSSSSSSSTSSSSTDSSSSSSSSDSEQSRKKRKKVVSSKIVKTQKSKKK